MTHEKLSAWVWITAIVCAGFGSWLGADTGRKEGREKAEAAFVLALADCQPAYYLDPPRMEAAPTLSPKEKIACVFLQDGTYAFYIWRVVGDEGAPYRAHVEHAVVTRGRWK